MWVEQLCPDIWTLIYHDCLDDEDAIKLQEAICVPSWDVDNPVPWLRSTTSPFVIALRSRMKIPPTNLYNPFNSYATEHDLNWMPRYEAANVVPVCVGELFWHQPSSILKPHTLVINKSDFQTSAPLPSIQRVSFQRTARYDIDTDELTFSFPDTEPWPALEMIDVFLTNCKLTICGDALPELKCLLWMNVIEHGNMRGSFPNLQGLVMGFATEQCEPPPIYCPKLIGLGSRFFPWRAMHANQLTLLDTIDSLPNSHEPVYPKVTHWSVQLSDIDDPMLGNWLPHFPGVQLLVLKLFFFGQKNILPPKVDFPPTLQEVQVHGGFHITFDEPAWRQKFGAVKLTIHS